MLLQVILVVDNVATAAVVVVVVASANVVEGHQMSTYFSSTKQGYDNVLMDRVAANEVSLGKPPLEAKQRSPKLLTKHNLIPRKT